MRVVCCICREAIGDRIFPKKKITASFAWRNRGLCPTCYERARAAIALAYSEPQAGPVVHRVRPVTGDHRR